MVRARQGRHPKTLEERREYWRTVIRAPAGPTLEDTSPIIDPTDRSLAAEEKPAATFRTTRQRSPFRRFLRENAIEIIVGSILIPIFLWGAYQLYTLNREMGETRTALESSKATVINLHSQVDKVERRLTGQISTISSDVDRLEQRVDQLIDRRGE